MPRQRNLPYVAMNYIPGPGQYLRETRGYNECMTR
jgi:hypothetical protein